MSIPKVQAMIERDTQIDRVTNGRYRIEKHNGIIKKKVKLNPIKHSRKSMQEKIEKEMKNPPIPVEVQIITDSENDDFIAEELNNRILKLPYIEDIKKKDEDSPMSTKIQDGDETLHIGVYTVLNHWVDDSKTDIE